MQHASIVRSGMEELNMADNVVWPGDVRQDEYEYDLHPEGERPGVNDGLRGAHPEKMGVNATAYDIKELHGRLQGYTDDELRQIVILPQGSRLEQGATYIDLRSATPREFTATGEMVTGPHNWFVPKTEVDYQLWNRLIGVQNPERR